MSKHFYAEREGCIHQSELHDMTIQCLNCSPNGNYDERPGGILQRLAINKMATLQEGDIHWVKYHISE